MKNNFNLLRNLLLFALIMHGFITYAQPNFINPIPIPPVLDADSGDIYLEMRPQQHLYNPMSIDPNDSLNGGAGYPGIESWCYNLAGDTAMTTLGPTLRWHTGDSVIIHVKNMLPAPTTTHWHGAEVPAKFDGGPHQPIAEDSSWTIRIKDLDSSSTMWYHPHYHNDTYRQVQYGLSGMILSEQRQDTIRDILPNTYSADDFPVIIGDQYISYNSDSMNYQIYPGKHRRPMNVVNGVVNPYLEVPAHFVRLRVLNGSTRKGIQMGVTNDYSTQSSDSLKDFYLVATDGGYTMKMDTMTKIISGPGARTEILLDLREYTVGSKLYLRNLKETLPKSIIGSALQPTNNPNAGPDTTSGFAFLELRIVADSSLPVSFTPVDSIAPYTHQWTPDIIDTMNNIVNHRLKRLTGSPGQGFTINNTTYDMTTINDVVCVDTKEIWEIRNETSVSHPFHIHKIFFRILTVQDSSNAYLDLDSLGLNGPKDDILVRKGWTVRFLGAFDDFPNPIDPMLSYMYHCHILTHEDAMGGGMMHQFVVTDEYPCTLGEDEIQPEHNAILYPNPATNELFLKASSTEKSLVRIVDLQGKVVHEQKLDSFEDKASININTVPKGFYVLQWNTINGRIAKKLIIE